jgi:hypothetical protein
LQPTGFDKTAPVDYRYPCPARHASFTPNNKNTIMKIIITCLAALFLLTNGSAFAQQVADSSRDKAPEKGFWVTEAEKNPAKYTLYFYNNQNVLVYKEEIGQKLNIKKTWVRKLLKEVLEQSVAIHEKKLAESERQTVAARIEGQ